MPLPHLVTIYGSELAHRIESVKVLVVGAGGIGCELLKNLVQNGFRHIEVVDLDTIDVTNLNRQFLFRRQDVDKSKALVAINAVKDMCGVSGGSINCNRNSESDQTRLPELNLIPHHGNIKDSNSFDILFFEKFDVVFNALDNIQARSHVNRVCVGLKTILLEAGTTGYEGQATCHIPGKSECYECLARPKPVNYPVCTIRKVPEKPIHCIIWAKNLFDVLFGPKNDGNVLADFKEKMGNLILSSKSTDSNPQQQQSNVNSSSYQVAKTLYNQIFIEDIKSEVSMFADTVAEASNTLKVEATKFKPPTPLISGDDMEQILRRFFENRNSLDFDIFFDNEQSQPEKTMINGNNNHVNGSMMSSLGDSAIRKLNEFNCPMIERIKSALDSDARRIWSSVGAYFKLIDSINTILLERSDQIGNQNLTFTKEDSVAVDFVTAVSILRSKNYNIEPECRFDVESKAGNIVPAIATTNAIVAGLQIANFVNLLRNATLKSNNQGSSRTSTANSESNTNSNQDFSQKKLVTTLDIDVSAGRDCFCLYPDPIPTKKKGNLIIKSGRLVPPNSNCLICSHLTKSGSNGSGASSSGMIRLILRSLTQPWQSIADFAKKVLMNAPISMNAPCILLNSGNKDDIRCIYDSAFPEPSEEAEEEGFYPDKSLQELGVFNGCILSLCDASQLNTIGIDAVVVINSELSEADYSEGYHVIIGDHSSDILSKNKDLKTEVADELDQPVMLDSEDSITMRTQKLEPMKNGGVVESNAGSDSVVLLEDSEDEAEIIEPKATNEDDLKQESVKHNENGNLNDTEVIDISSDSNEEPHQPSKRRKKE